ncbi:MAG TPA: Bax inhibitor-1/YccA family protein [Steroidobacteraceae bacterium]|nr:Bax inhibitor-1/YccA family protein [Steroidobacteraceae bacterium]
MPSPDPNPYPYFRPSGALRAGAESGLRAYLIQVYNYMAGGLVLTGVAAYVGAASGFYASLVGTPWLWLVLLAPLALVLLLGFRIDRMSLPAAQLAFWAYAALVGLSLSGIFLVYTGNSIARVFFITAATFAATSVYGYTTGRDLSRLGSFLFMGLIGVIIAMVVNVFLKSTALQMTISVMGVIVFTGLSAYDTQKIKASYVYGEDGTVTGKKSIFGALMLYLDFLNLFLMLMQLLGDRRR